MRDQIELRPAKGIIAVDETRRSGPDADEIVSLENMQIDPATPLFRVRSFALLFVTRVASTTAKQMLAVVVGWHVYELTDSALNLGLIGLVQFLPPLLLMLAAGEVGGPLQPAADSARLLCGRVLLLGRPGGGGAVAASEHSGDLRAAVRQRERAHLRAAGHAVAVAA